jgi:N-acetylmuramoyl-L-alanine amidase
MEVKGHSYVTARSVKEFYRFDKMEVKNGFLVLENKPLECKLPLQGTEGIFNGIRIHLEFPILPHEERHLVSRTTLAMTLDPILRPRFAPKESRKHLSLIVVDPEPMPVKDAGDVTLKLAYGLRAELEALRFKVALTREDEKVSLNDRIKAMNGHEEAYVLSLRITNKKDGPEGIRTWILAPESVPGHDDIRDAARWRRAPANAHDFLSMAVATGLHSKIIQDTGRPDRGIARSHETLLKESKNPTSILVLGNLAKAEEGKLLKQAEFQDTLARAIANGLHKAKVATGQKDAGR